MVGVQNFGSSIISLVVVALVVMTTSGCDSAGAGGSGGDVAGGGASVTDVVFQSAVETGGTSGTADSTGLTLTFDVDPTALTADSITVTGATKGALSGSGTTRSLAITDISVGNGETVTVTISNPSGYSISGSPKTAVVYKQRTYEIGDIGPSGVGIVFYVTDGGLHGLEVAPEDQNGGVAWITGGSTQTTLNDNTGTPIGSGPSNTAAITGQPDHDTSAAQISKDYRGGGLSDWFLPSKDELDAIWNNLVDNGSGENSGIGGFANAYFWSSSEGTRSSAWMQYFGSGGQQYTNNKNGTFIRVRAVRAF